jgi:hypothetical protein
MSQTAPKYPQSFYELLTVPGVVPMLERLNANLAALTAQVSKIQPETVVQQAQASGSTVALPAASVRLPLTIHDIVLAALEAGETQNLYVYDDDYIVTVAPGAVNIQSFPTYGRPTTIIGSLNASADEYSATGLLTVQVFVDGTPVSGPNATSAIQLTGPKSVTIAQYAVAKTEVQVVTANLMTVNANLNFQGVQAVMSADFYKNTAEPLLNQYGFASLKRLIGQS